METLCCVWRAIIEKTFQFCTQFHRLTLCSVVETNMQMNLGKLIALLYHCMSG